MVSRRSLAASVLSLLSSSAVLIAQAKTVTYDWNITWVTASPDGFSRPVIGINNQWPIPVLNITKGDRIIAHVHNMLGNQSTGMHFHGMFQNGTNHMDGPVGITQCEIPPGSSFTYNFTVDQPGTYWYHSHIRGQYTDGIRGQFLVTDPDSPLKGQYDEEIAFTLSDWYHNQMPYLLNQFISVYNPTGAEPVPDNALMNDTQDFSVNVKPGKTYLFRMTNVGAFAGQYFWIEGHNMSVVEVDGVYTQPMTTSMIYLTAAQRYSFLVTTNNDTSTNFAMVGSMDTDLFDQIPDSLNWNVTGYLVYNDSAPMPTPAEVDDFESIVLDDFTLIPQDNMTLLDKVDYSLSLELTMDDLSDGANYAFFNDITYVMPKVPTLYTTLSSGNLSEEPGIYGDNVNAFFLEKGQVVEIVLNNDDPGKHPFHLHGHNFQAVYRGADDEGPYDPTANNSFPAIPMRRDTLMVRPGGNFVIRFIADNPGIWLFHCHIEWHLVTGLAATMIEAAPELQSLVIPEDHWQVCKDSKTPYVGNAAGNTVNWLDLSGENLPPAPIPAGFTTRGIVALVFSCISAFLGMAAIAWYGSAPITKADVAAAKRKIETALSHVLYNESTLASTYKPLIDTVCILPLFIINLHLTKPVMTGQASPTILQALEEQGSVFHEIFLAVDSELRKAVIDNDEKIRACIEDEPSDRLNRILYWIASMIDAFPGYKEQQMRELERLQSFHDEMCNKEVIEYCHSLVAKRLSRSNSDLSELAESHPLRQQLADAIELREAKLAQTMEKIAASSLGSYIVDDKQVITYAD